MAEAVKKMMWAKYTLGVPGVEAHSVLKGDEVWVTETFQDDNGTWCYVFETYGAGKGTYHTACTNLRKTAPYTPPPSDALEATGGARA